MLRRVCSNLLIRIVIGLAVMASPMLPHGAPTHAHGLNSDQHASTSAIIDSAAFAEIDDHGHDHEIMADGSGDEGEQFGPKDRHPHPVHEDHHHSHAVIAGDGTFLIGVKDVRFPAYQNHCLSNGPGELLRPPRSLSLPCEEA